MTFAPESKATIPYPVACCRSTGSDIASVMRLPMLPIYMVMLMMMMSGWTDERMAMTPTTRSSGMVMPMMATMMRMICSWHYKQFRSHWRSLIKNGDQKYSTIIYCRQIRAVKRRTRRRAELISWRKKKEMAQQTITKTMATARKTEPSLPRYGMRPRRAKGATETEIKLEMLYFVQQTG